MSHFSFLQQEDGFQDILKSDPDRFNSLIQFIGGLMKQDACDLSVGEREFIIAYVVSGHGVIGSEALFSRVKEALKKLGPPIYDN